MEQPQENQYNSIIERTEFLLDQIRKQIDTGIRGLTDNEVAKIGGLQNFASAFLQKVKGLNKEGPEIDKDLKELDAEFDRLEKVFVDVEERLSLGKRIKVSGNDFLRDLGTMFHELWENIKHFFEMIKGEVKFRFANNEEKIHKAKGEFVEELKELLEKNHIKETFEEKYKDADVELFNSIKDLSKETDPEQYKTALNGVKLSNVWNLVKELKKEDLAHKIGDKVREAQKGKEEYKKTMVEKMQEQRGVSGYKGMGR